MADAGELDQIAISGGVFGQNHQVIAPLLFLLGVINRPIHHVHLIADDRLDAGALAELEKLNSAVHHAVIGQSQGRHPQFFCPLHHLGQL